MEYPLPFRQQDRMLAIAADMLGQPYRWGGDREDCSGFVQECELSVGIHPQPGTDLTAHALYEIRVARGQVIEMGNVRPGCEAFWLSGDRATHVEFVLTPAPAPLCIGAAGGNSKTEGGDEFLEQIAEWLHVPAAERVAWIKATNPIVREALRTLSSRTVADLQDARVRVRPLHRPGESRKLVLADPWKEATS